MRGALALIVSVISVVSSQEELATDALAQGRSLKWQMRNQTPFKREAMRLRAVRSFRSGVKRMRTRELQALCAFRAGELLRAGGLGEAALLEFGVGAGLGPSSWGHDCALAAGKMLIALGRHGEAVSILQGVVGEAVPSRFAEAALVLRGVALSKMGRIDLAVDAWRTVAEHGVTPRVRLEAFECWGHYLLDAGDPEGAAGVLHACRVALTPSSLEATAQGIELRVMLQNSPLATAIRRDIHLRCDTPE